MNQSPLIQSSFTMQMFFYQTLQNMLMITCSTNFQGAILTKNVIKLFSKKASMHTNCSISRLPLLSQLPRTPSSVLSCLQSLHASGRVPQTCPVQGKAISQVTTLRCVAIARRSVQVRTAVQTKPSTQPGWEKTNSEPMGSNPSFWIPQTYTLLFSQVSN